MRYYIYIQRHWKWRHLHNPFNHIKNDTVVSMKCSFCCVQKFSTCCRIHVPNPPEQCADTTLPVNHANCLEQGTFRHTYGNLIHSIRLHLNPPPFIPNLSSGLKVCMGNAQATMS